MANLFQKDTLLREGANYQSNVAEPFLRGLSPIPAEQLPFIGKNFHPPIDRNSGLQPTIPKYYTGLGLALQTLATGSALAPLKLAREGLVAKTLGPNLANYFSRAVEGAKIGASAPLESKSLRDLLSDRKYNALIGGALGNFNPVTASQIPIINQGRAAGSIIQNQFSPLKIARDLLSLGGAHFLGSKR